MVSKTVGGVPFLSSPLLERTGAVAHGFSTRLGGVSRPPFDTLNLGFNRGDDPERVAENYRLFSAAIGTDSGQRIRNRQIHSDLIRQVTGPDAPGAEPCAADGLVTDLPSLCLTVFTADCIPLLLCDPRRRCIAAVHSGWRSTAMTIAARAVETMVTNYGCRAEDIVAAIGPSIGPCCFETDRDVPDAMPAWSASHIHPLGGQRYRVDLKAIVVQTLMRCGVTADHMDVSDHCTACRTDLYWSHRLLGADRGSMAAMIQLL